MKSNDLSHKLDICLVIGLTGNVCNLLMAWLTKLVIFLVVHKKNNLQETPRIYAVPNPTALVYSQDIHDGDGAFILLISDCYARATYLEGQFIMWAAHFRLATNAESMNESIRIKF